MNFSVISEKASERKSDSVVVGVFASRTLSEDAKLIDRVSRGQLTTMLELTAVTGKCGETVTLYGIKGIAAERLVLVGLGDARAMDASEFNKMVSKMAAELIANDSTNAAVYLNGIEVKDCDERWQLRTLVQGISDATYRFDEMKSKAERSPRPRLKRVQLSTGASTDSAARRKSVAFGAAVAAGVSLAKDLGNRPGNLCTPTYLAEQALEMAKKNKQLKTKIVDEAAMKRLGMGSLLSVSAGSRQPAKLIVMHYSGGPGNEKPVVLVGKGVTFDTGGISLKPGASMDEMKFDMCGAASVFGVMQALCQSQLPLNVVGIIPATENMPDGQATKPGDIVTSMSGQTIEILNTDAEGRLILCDAITYAERFKPQVVIDIATLTGACVVALGAHASGLFSNDDALANALLLAGEHSGDRAWRMPIWKEYAEQLKSNFADVANIGGREAGAVTAACFLARFARNLQWAHLDIAGAAWRSGKAKGATGRPVALLCQYLLSRCGS